MRRYSFADPVMVSRIDRPSELDTGSLNLGDGFTRNVRKTGWELYWAYRIARADKASHGGIFGEIMNDTVVLFRHAPFAVAHIAWTLVPVAVVLSWVF